jgi:hypothetical protein
LGNANPPTDTTATIFDQTNVGPTFSGLSFSVRTGNPPADALTVDLNRNVGIGNEHADAEAGSERDGEGNGLFRRWVGAVLLEAEERFHRVQGYQEMPLLIQALGKVVDTQEAVA